MSASRRKRAIRSIFVPEQATHWLVTGRPQSPEVPEDFGLLIFSSATY